MITNIQKQYRRRSFSLIEVLIVVGIISVLATFTLIVLQPQRILGQVRDVTRVKDLAVIDSAVQFAQLQNPSLNLGNAMTVYVSLPAAMSDCSDLGFSSSSLPPGWSYRCVTTAANLRKSDGTGWIPVNFSSVASPPLVTLPIDPINTFADGYYYTYSVGSWKVTATLESRAHLAKMRDDGGPDALVYEKGTNLDTANFARQLVGYWKFDNSTADTSGFGNAATIPGGSTYETGEFGGGVSLGGPQGYITISTPVLPTGDFTYMTWVQPTLNAHETVFMASDGFGNDELSLVITSNGGIEVTANGSHLGAIESASPTLAAATWYHFALTRSGSSVKLYINSQLVGSDTAGGVLSFGACPLFIGATAESGCGGGLSKRLDGAVDEFRIYHRALSSNEITTHYLLTK